MIDPFDVTNYERDQWELEEFLIFCICVANKRADQTAEKVSKFLPKNKHMTPFRYIEIMVESGDLEELIKWYKFGQYSRILKIFELICTKDVTKLTFEELIAIPGIGAKTAHYFLLHSQKGYEGVALDTHMLRHLRNNGVEAPKNTPPYGPKYKSLADKFRELWKEEGQEMTLAEYDLHIWTKYASSKPKTETV